MNNAAAAWVIVLGLLAGDASAERLASQAYVGSSITIQSCEADEEEQNSTPSTRSACFRIEPGEVVVTVSVEDVTDTPIGGLYWFERADGSLASVSEEFCETTDLVEIPTDARYLLVMLEQEANIPVLQVGEPANSCQEELGLVTMGEILGSFEEFEE